MALTPYIYVDETGKTIDSLKMAVGWNAPHNALLAPTAFESFGNTGTVKVLAASTNKPSTSSVPFKVICRAADGTETVKTTGIMPSNAYNKDFGDLSLTLQEWAGVAPSDAYGAEPNGSVVPSALKAGYNTWAEAPADGFGLIITLIMLLN